ncbi:unnamed protein product [Dibothriocephalus latus]|uniref:Lipocalin/cytosolic fatty-acid binding domain-containing protein n=1 Tax=Dibothriocephalus latus TaxID=60516 RepID=A0A3P6Q540_DIBLA|nr:unnamed protein product [Dibothriocephalus latus]
MAAFIGSWKQESVDGLDVVLKHLGVNFVKRKAAGVLSLTLTFACTDDQYECTTSTSTHSFVTSFKPGVPYADQNPDGKPVQVGDLVNAAAPDGTYTCPRLDYCDHNW